MARIRRRSADTESMVSELIKLLNRPEGRKRHHAAGQGHPPRRTRWSWRSILALAGVPARTVHGVVLKEPKRRLPLVHWLEV